MNRNPPLLETRQADGEICAGDFAFVYLDIESPPIAWLAYRGVVNSCDVVAANPGNLSWFLVDIVKRGLSATLRREGILEGFRLKEFPDRLSRLRCVYAYPSLEIAKRGDYCRSKFHIENLVAISPVGEIRHETHDSNWITDFDSLPKEVGRRYWAGDMTQNPLTEYLLNGRFVILGTSVRRRAYETIKRTSPNSLAMLELSRLAAMFGSDLGSISPWLKQEGDQIVVTFIIRYTESEGLAVFQQAIEEQKRDPNFQVNWVDLEPLCKNEPDRELDARFSTPDLGKYKFRRDKLDELNGFISLVMNAKSLEQ